MADRIFTYVDGESHFIRAEAAWKSLHQGKASLSQLRYNDQPDKNLILVYPEFKIFWTRKFCPGQRTSYFTAVWGDDDNIHGAKKLLRDFSLEPRVVVEKKPDAMQRQALLESGRVIEKPKGVDCALIVQVMEDVQRDFFDICHLFTSDVDYIPLIKAVQNCGKRVIVHGFSNGLGRNSLMDCEPDRFVDLSEMLKNECELHVERAVET